MAGSESPTPQNAGTVETVDATMTAPGASTGFWHRLDVLGEALNDGAIEVVSSAGLLVDAVNNAPRILNVLPGEQGFSTFADHPFLGSEMIRDNLTGAHETYKDVMGIETPEILDATDRAIDIGGELAGGAIVTMGVGTLASGAARATTTVAKPGAIDVVADLLGGGTRIANGTRFAAITPAAGAGARFGMLAAAEEAGLSAMSTFANSASNMVRSMLATGRAGAAALVDDVAALTTRVLPSNTGTLLANTAISGAKLATRLSARTAWGLTKFGVRHPVMSAGALAVADTAYNNGAGTAAVARKTGNAAMEMLGLGALTPSMPDLSALTGMNMASIGETMKNMGLELPPEWQQRGKQLLHDFADSSFGQWLVSGSAGSRLLLGFLSWMIVDGIKDRLIGNDMATNVVTLGVGVAASQMLPELLKSWLEDDTRTTSMEADNRPAPAMEFAPSNPGGMAGGMTFAPAAP